MKQSKQKTSEHVIRLANTETVTVDEESWKKGKSMIDLFYVAKQLFCRQCKEALALISITSEKIWGMQAICLYDVNADKLIRSRPVKRTYMENVVHRCMMSTQKQH